MQNDQIIFLRSCLEATKAQLKEALEPNQTDRYRLNIQECIDRITGSLKTHSAIVNLEKYGDEYVRKKLHQ